TRDRPPLAAAVLDPGWVAVWFGWPGAAVPSCRAVARVQRVAAPGRWACTRRDLSVARPGQPTVWPALESWSPRGVPPSVTGGTGGGTPLMASSLGVRATSRTAAARRFRWS